LCNQKDDELSVGYCSNIAHVGVLDFTGFKTPLIRYFVRPERDSTVLKNR
jgi:hypothetical protein